MDTEILDERISRFESECITAIMGLGYDRSEARDIFNDWLIRAGKRAQAHRLSVKLMRIG